MRLGLFELLLIAAIIILLFNTKRLTRLFGALGRSKTEYRRGLEEPVDVESRVVSDESEKTRQKR